MKFAFQILLAAGMVYAGAMHFIRPKFFIRIVPDYLPNPAALVYISGFFEILGGVGLLIPRFTVISAWGLIALYIAVFPANVNMAVNHIPVGHGATPEFLLWLRLPLQFVLIAWAWWFTRL